MRESMPRLLLDVRRARKPGAATTPSQTTSGRWRTPKLYAHSAITSSTTSRLSAEKPPEQSPGGKHREIIPLS